MKRVFVALVLLATVFACNKAETGDGPLPGRIPILFGVGSTKAVGVTDGDKIQGDANGFKVAALEAETRFVMFNEAAKYDAEHSYYRTDQWYYYPNGAMTQAVDFYAVYPADKEIVISDETGALTLEDYVPRNGTATNPGEDLVVAVKTGVLPPDGVDVHPVDLVFNHVLSRLSVRCIGLVEGVDFELTGGSITYNTKATFTFDPEQPFGGAWTLAAEDATTTRTLPKQDIADAGGYESQFLTDVPVIPGDVVINLSWKCYLKGDTHDETHQIGDEYHCEKVLSATMGKFSTIKCQLGFKGQPIVFTVDVNDWETETLEIPFLPED